MHARVLRSFFELFYPGTETYRNKLGILDRVELEQMERHLTAARAEEGFPARANHKTYRAFKAIHRHLFQDLYGWAGKERRYTTGRGEIPFAVPEYIERTMEALFAELARNRYLIGYAKHDFAEAAPAMSTRLTLAILSLTAMAERNASGHACLPITQVSN